LSSSASAVSADGTAPGAAEIFTKQDEKMGMLRIVVDPILQHAYIVYFEPAIPLGMELVGSAGPIHN
jgi:hypothetical protein